MQSVRKTLISLQPTITMQKFLASFEKCEASSNASSVYLCRILHSVIFSGILNIFSFNCVEIYKTKISTALLIELLMSVSYFILLTRASHCYILRD